ncbi:MAG: Fumarate hydratase class II [Methanobacterium sp. PtaU1.Bin097]|jgi:argininosuccinate lyase|nr:MAG: Fumarate hydratase class II [Methanobacterium sp. PtaU1.Bin097]
MNLRSGRLKGKMTSDAAQFTSSLDFDQRIFLADIQCNLAHTTMLKEQGIIPEKDADQILQALNELEDEGIEALYIDPSVEDIHMALENYVTSKVGEVAGFMHTGKSRNDQVATDLRLVLREELSTIQAHLLKFISGILDLADGHTETVTVGYTHLQHAQPTTFAHHLLSYAYALKRDYERIKDAYKRVDMCPLGSAALTTTSFPIDRNRTCELLGFSKILENSIDGVSSRDFISETVSSLSILCTTLSKICEELIIWSTYEFGLIEIAGEYSSTSSIMPQKKNPDVAEIARAKCAGVYGELVAILTILKSLPQSYNRDLQEVTPHLWSAVDSSHSLLNITAAMLSTTKFNQKRGEELAEANFSTATELADLMVKEKKLPFRVAHQIVGRTVSKAIEEGLKPSDINPEYIDVAAQELTGENLKLDRELVKNALDPQQVIRTRKVIGGPAPEMVEEAISNLREFVDRESNN